MRVTVMRGYHNPKHNNGRDYGYTGDAFHRHVIGDVYGSLP